MRYLNIRDIITLLLLIIITLLLLVIPQIRKIKVLVEVQNEKGIFPNPRADSILFLCNSIHPGPVNFAGTLPKASVLSNTMTQAVRLKFVTYMKKKIYFSNQISVAVLTIIGRKTSTVEAIDFLSPISLKLFIFDVCTEKKTTNVISTFQCLNYFKQWNCIIPLILTTDVHF